ncbi:Sulfotransferase [Entamoeba marina]
MQSVKLVSLECDKNSPYYRELLPMEEFDRRYAEMKQMAIGLLCQLDPSHADLYKTILPEYDHYLENSEFKQNIRELYAGCQDETSPCTQMVTNGMPIRLASYLKFLKERDYDKENLDKVKINKMLYIFSLPRSGSTFTHALLSADPHANTVSMYEHYAPGSKTMKKESRIMYAQKIADSVNENDNFNTVHAFNDVTKPEEETLFAEMLGCTLMFGYSVPRLEIYRSNSPLKDFHYVFEHIIDELKMHLVEKPLNEGDYLCLKSATFTFSPLPFFDVFGREEYGMNLVWSHREPVENIKSAILLYYSVRQRNPHELGFDDIKWLNDTIINYNVVMLKNSIAVRDQWIKENPERAKRIYDLSFTKLTKDPIGTMKDIYKYFGMEYTDEYEQRIKNIIENDHPQKNMYTFDENEVREKFKFYYDRFSEYLPNYYGKP